MSETHAVSTNPTAVSEIHETLSLLFHEGDAIIVSYLVANNDRMAKSAFTSIDGAAGFAESLDQDPAVTNIYVNLQHLKPGSTTDKRQDVASYVRFLVDIDRRNKKVDGVRVNATEEERASLRKTADEVTKWVSGILGAHPLVADSGNGFHLCWYLRPNAFTDAIAPSDDNKITYKECLLAIKQRFDSEAVEIDASLSEPEQIIRLWGTWNRRDPETEGRPHRQSAIISKARGTVSLAHLGVLACEYKAPAKGPTAAKGDAPTLHPDFDEASWWEHYRDIFVCEEERDGWQVTSICPATYEGTEWPGHRHTGSRLSGVRFDRGIAEFHCFSDDHCDMTFGQVMKHLNQHYPPFPGKIWDWGEEDFSDFAEDVTAADEMPDGTAVKPNGHDESYNLKGTPCPTCLKELVAGAQDKECKSCMRKSALREKLQPGEVELTSGNKDGGRVALAILEAHNIETEELVWLWWGRILGSKINLFAGLGDCCKSTVLTDLIARITTGRDFPDGIKNTMGPRRVLLAFTEDDAADTVVPKLMVAGADLTKVLIISKVNGVDAEGNRFRRPFNLTDDLTLLEKALRENPDIALVALDPIASFWGKKDSNKDDDMRPVMESLKEMTARHRVALIGILHLNKKTDLKPTQRVGGAGSIANVSRCVWMFSQDPEDKDEYYMSKGKGNLIPRGVKGLKYTTIETPMTFSNGKLGTMFKVDWLGEHEMNADEVSRIEKDVDKGVNVPTMTDQMKLWLREELEKGPRLATEMYDSGDMRFGDGKPKGDEGKKDIGKTLKRAQLAIGGQTTKRRPFYWYLPGYGPNPEEEPQGTEDSQIPVQDVL
jgi:putative DNA primase/helicase